MKANKHPRSVVSCPRSPVGPKGLAGSRGISRVSGGSASVRTVWTGDRTTPAADGSLEPGHEETFGSDPPACRTQPCPRPDASLGERILDCFPAGAYALHGLPRLLAIVETTDVPSAAVDCADPPRLRINPDFVRRHAPTPERLLMLVMHELHHVILGHTRFFRAVTPRDNLVLDAVINAMLCRMFPGEEYAGFFTDLYDAGDFPACLLRPPPGWRPDAPPPLPPGLRNGAPALVRDVYRALYSERGAGYRELYDALREALPEGAVTGLVLVGSHGEGDASGGKQAGDLPQASPVLFEAVRRIVESWPQPPDPIAGRSLADIVRGERVAATRRRTNRAILRSLIRRVAGVDGAGEIRRARRREDVDVATPVPTFDRRSLVLRALGRPPLLFTGTVPDRRLRPAGERVHVYVDVSGSIGDLKGALYGAVLDCGDLVFRRVHLFSTLVHDVTLEELRRGHCKTTGGTCISCVAEHMATHRVRRAVILTDGYVGRPAGTHARTLNRAKLGVALTPGFPTRTDLSDVADHWAALREEAAHPAGAK